MSVEGTLCVIGTLYMLLLDIMVNSKTIWLILLLLAAGIFLIGLWLLDFSDLSFSSNANAYISILASTCMMAVWAFIRRRQLTLKNRYFILNVLIGASCLYFLLFVVLNITDSSLTRRLLGIIPPFCGIMFAVTAKRDLKKFYQNNPADSEQKKDNDH